jgi:hypothetical protein
MVDLTIFCVFFKYFSQFQFFAISAKIRELLTSVSGISVAAACTIVDVSLLTSLLLWVYLLLLTSVMLLLPLLLSTQLLSMF